MQATQHSAHLVGQRFGQLAVIEFSHVARLGAFWACRCDCQAVITAYTSQLRRGEVVACGSCTERAKVRRRFWSKVDKTETCWIWDGSHNGLGHGQFWLDGRKQKAYRVAYEWLVGPIPAGLEIDHMCWNSRCVNPNHLRTVTHQQNGQNRSGPAASNTYGIRGVYKWKQRWKAEGQVNGKSHHIGLFKTIEEAEQAAIAWRAEHYTHSLRDQAAMETAR